MAPAGRAVAEPELAAGQRRELRVRAAPVAYRADTASAAVSIATMASEPGTAAYNVAESADSSSPVTPGSESIFAMTVPL